MKRVFVGSAVVQIAAMMLAALIGCSCLAGVFRPKKLSHAPPSDNTVQVPEFSISVKLSPLADARLRELKETILVIAYFDGDPLPGQGRYNPPFRDVYLGEDRKLVDAKNTATFDGTKISQSAWNRLADKNYFVTINIVSARQRSKNNLLDCGVPIARVREFKDKNTEVRCSLIGEPDAPLTGRGTK